MFIGVVAGAVNQRTLTVIQALINFIYYSQIQLQTSKTLVALESYLNIFHSHKDLKLIFVSISTYQNFMQSYITSMPSGPWDQQTDTIPNPQSISTLIVPRRVIVKVITVITLSRWQSGSNDERQCGSERHIFCGLRRDFPLHKQWVKEKRLMTATATQNILQPQQLSRTLFPLLCHTP